MNKEKNCCENCGKDCDYLHTRQGFLMTFFVEWLCDDCYAKFEKEFIKESVEKVQEEITNI